MTDLSLKTKVTVFIAVVVIAINLVSTLLFISAHKKHIEKEIIARGITLAESLSRVVDEGLASENLEFIKAVEDIAHTKDVNLAQVYTPLWLAVDAYPAEKLNEEAAADAIKHFATSEAPFYMDIGSWFDFYSPVFYHSPGSAKDARKVVIGYVRIKISTDEVRQATRHTVVTNIIVSALLTFFAVLILNAFVRRYVLRPITKLHESISRHREGEFPESVPVTSADEIGQLSSEFNRMCHALKEREERLSDEKERLAVTLRSIGDGVIVTDVKGTVLLLNRVAELYTGWTAEESSGRQLAEVFNIVNEKTRERCENPVEKVIKTGIIIGLANHTALIRKDGTEIIIEDSAAPIRDRHSEIIGVVLVFRDATEKRRMEEELLKAEKLQSVGLLAGGLAHDFNNLLTAMAGNISLAKKLIDPENKAYTRLTEAEKASRRATELTHQLLTFAKGGAPIKRTTSIVDIIRESARFALTGTNVAAEFAAAGDVWNVDIDAGQMSQVFNNLIINAVHAMPEGGALRFIVENVALAEQEIPTLRPGTYLKISVRDSGTGIGEDHLSRIFDPYFTTKPKGSGLGLASVYSIVKKHEGHIVVESKPGQGTTFHLYLPASRNSKVISKTAEEGIVAGGQGKILVMDDEQVIRDLSGEMLRSLGYEVEFARHGMEAVELYRKAQDSAAPFRAVVMDLTVPGGMGGKEAIRKLRALDPHVTAIVSSGYSNDPIMADYETYGFKGVIMKPYTIESFSKTLSDVIKE